MSVSSISNSMTSDTSIQLQQTPISPSPSYTTVSSNGQKYGTIIANRIFVGGLNSQTSEEELKKVFEDFGLVKEVKIITNQNPNQTGTSKGKYGFVTFETAEVAEKLIKREEHIIFKDRKLNIAPAVRKLNRIQPQPIYDSSTMFAAQPNTFFIAPNSPTSPYYNGMILTNADGSSPYGAQNGQQFQMIFPQQYYLQSYGQSAQATQCPQQQSTVNSGQQQMNQLSMCNSNGQIPQQSPVRWSNMMQSQAAANQMFMFPFPQQNAQQIPPEMLYGHTAHHMHHGVDFSEATMMEATPAEMCVMPSMTTTSHNHE